MSDDLRERLGRISNSGHEQSPPTLGIGRITDQREPEAVERNSNRRNQSRARRYVLTVTGFLILAALGWPIIQSQKQLDSAIVDLPESIQHPRTINNARAVSSGPSVFKMEPELPNEFSSLPVAEPTLNDLTAGAERLSTDIQASRLALEIAETEQLLAETLLLSLLRQPETGVSLPNLRPSDCTFHGRSNGLNIRGISRWVSLATQFSTVEMSDSSAVPDGVSLVTLYMDATDRISWLRKSMRELELARATLLAAVPLATEHQALDSAASVLSALRKRLRLRPPKLTREMTHQAELRIAELIEEFVLDTEPNASPESRATKALNSGNWRELLVLLQSHSTKPAKGLLTEEVVRRINYFLASECEEDSFRKDVVLNVMKRLGPSPFGEFSPPRTSDVEISGAALDEFPAPAVVLRIESPSAALHISPLTNQLIALGEDGIARVFDIVEGNLKRSVNAHVGNHQDFGAFVMDRSTDGAVVAVAARSDTVLLIDTSDWQVFKELRPRNLAAVEALKFLSGGRLIVQLQGAAYVYDKAGNELCCCDHAAIGYSRGSIELNGDHTLVRFGHLITDVDSLSEHSECRVFGHFFASKDLNYVYQHSLRYPVTTAESVTLQTSANGLSKIVKDIVIDVDSRTTFKDLKTGKVLFRFQQKMSDIMRSESGLLAVGTISYGRTVCLIDIKSKTVRQLDLSNRDGRVANFASSDDDSWVAIGWDNGSVEVYPQWNLTKNSR